MIEIFFMGYHEMTACYDTMRVVAFFCDAAARCIGKDFYSEIKEK